MPLDEETRLRRMNCDDGQGLCDFYNGLSVESKTLFRPLGEQAALERCVQIAGANSSEVDARLDIVAVAGDRIIGWASLDQEQSGPTDATFGIGVADDWQDRGLGKKLMDEVMGQAAGRGLKRVDLTVVQYNDRARHIYESRGFKKTGTKKGTDGLDYFCMSMDIGS